MTLSATTRTHTLPSAAGLVPLWWMLATSLGSWLVLAAVVGPRGNPELLWGMLGPLAATSGTWMVARAARPERLTGVMMAAMPVKMLLFGVYVAAMLRGLELRPVAFMASFTGYFIALYTMEALFLNRLFLSRSNVSTTT